MANTFGHLHWSDLLVIALYFMVSMAIGVYTMCKTRNNLKSFVLAGRSLTWWPIGMSLFASNIGSINFVGIAGSAAASGLAVVMFEWSAVFLLVLLGWVFIPVYMASGIYTVPEYLQVRFGGQRLRVYLSCIALLTYCFAILSVDLYSGALFIQHTVGWNIYIGVAIILGSTLLLTLLGGLMTVVLTDALAVCVMIASGFLLFILGIVKIGGFNELYIKYNAAIPNITLPNTTCGFPRDDAWHIFRDSFNPEYPGLGTILRTTFGSLWFWCSNQLIVQRSLAAKTIVHAKAGSLLACYLKLTPIFIMVIPGMISRAMFPDEVACATPDTCEAICGNRAGCSNIAYPKLATTILPNGLRGLLLAAMLAAVISSLTSIFNSSSSIVTIDIWKRLRPSASEREQMIVAKCFLVILVAISVAWIPTMENAEGGQIYRYAQASVGLFGGPTCGLFLMAIFTTVINEKGAFWGLIIGQIWGLLRFVLNVIYPAPPCGEIDERPVFLTYWHVYYHVISQIILTALIALVISLFTQPLSRSRLAGTTFWTLYHIKKEQSEENMKVIDRTEGQQLKDRIDGGQTEEGKKTLVQRILISLKHSCIVGNEDLLNKPDIPDRLQILKQGRLCTVLLNINAFLVVLGTAALYIYLR